MTAQDVIQSLTFIGTPESARNSARFFKTGPGQYGEDDRFLGVIVPEQRKIAKTYKDLPLDETVQLLSSPYHECRLTALFIMVGQYQKGTNAQKKLIYDTYLANTKYINNWDLVDSSASYIVGPQLARNYRSVLVPLARSYNLWERRIAILSCFYYINLGNPAPAFEIIELLKNDRHDLIQKAVGWMLREIGKRCGRQTLDD